MDRLSRLRASMTEQSIDLVVLGPGAHLGWLLGVRPHADERPLLFCVTQFGEGFLMPALEAESARQHTDLAFHTWDDALGPLSALEALLSDIGAKGSKSIALDESMRADFAALVQDRLPEAARQFSATTIGALRMRKDATEYAELKRNALIADKVMQTAWAAMAPGMTEAEVGQVIKDAFAADDVKPLFGIVGAGSNSAFPHHQTGETVLRLGDAIVMDLGGASGGYSSDITRMAVLGEPPEGFAEVHSIVDRAVEAALAAARPGVPAKAVDKAARDVITDAGYGEYFVHRTGHGLGTEVHEPPYLTASSETLLDEGMVFSIEPGIYLPGRFGVRLEEIVILRGDGPEILSELSRDAKVISG